MVLADVHVHIDFYNQPKKIAEKYEELKIYAVFVTYLPQIFRQHFAEYKNFKYVRLALGFHPDMVGEYDFSYDEFFKEAQKTKYIGEVGLDFTSKDDKLINEQIKIFEQITQPEINKGKIYSIHSRGAEREVLEILKKNKVKNAIFHWYSGNISNQKLIIESDYYFSVNIKMCTSKKGQELIKRVPLNKLLFETDGPFARDHRKIVQPENISDIYNKLEELIPEFEIQTFKNFKQILVSKDLDLYS